MGRNNSTTALNSPTMEAVFHFRSSSNLSTKSDDTVTSASVSRKGVRSIAEFAPGSTSVEDVSYTRTPTRDTSPRHAFCSSKLATTERCATYAQQNKLKLAILGDSGVGKTSLLMSLTTDKIPDTHAPTIYDKFNVSQAVYGKRMSVTWCDTAGQEDFAHLRQLCYSQINAAVICFSVTDRKSFDNVKDKWIDEVRCHCRNVPVILMGTQTDRRDRTVQQLRSKGSKSVSRLEGVKMAAHIKAATYIECSALDKESVKSVFNDAVLAALGLGPERLVSPAVQCAGCTIL